MKGKGLKGGGITIAGHRIPLSLLAIVAAIGAALLVVRQLRSSGSNLSVGSAPVDLAGAAYQAQLDQLTATEQSLAQVAGQLQTVAAQQPSAQPPQAGAPRWPPVSGIQPGSGPALDGTGAPLEPGAGIRTFFPGGVPHNPALGP